MKAKLHEVLLVLLAAVPVPALSAVAKDKLNALDEVRTLHQIPASSGNSKMNRVVKGLQAKGLIDRDVKNAPPPEPSHRG